MTGVPNISEFNFSGYHQILETFFTSLKVKPELRDFFSKANGEVFCFAKPPIQMRLPTEPQTRMRSFIKPQR